MNNPELGSIQIPVKGVFNENTMGVVENKSNIIFIFALYEKDKSNPVHEDAFQGNDLGEAYKAIKNLYPDADKYGYSIEQTSIPLQEIFGIEYKNYDEEVVDSK